MTEVGARAALVPLLLVSVDAMQFFCTASLRHVFVKYTRVIGGVDPFSVNWAPRT